MKPIQAEIESVLDTVLDPCSVSAGVPLSVREMGLVCGVDITDDGSVRVLLRLTSPGCIEGFMKFMHEIETGVGALDGVRSVEVDFLESVGWTESDISQEGRAKLALHREARSPSVLLGPSIPIGGAP
jgi:metal-sulfur cluster biosynthetic enzyme